MPVLRLAVLFACWPGLLPALATVSSVRVSTSPPGLKFTVDGVQYSQTAAMFWPAGSTHVLSVELDQMDHSMGARYAFQGWTDSNGRQHGPASAIKVVADPSVWFYQARFKVEYRLQLSFFACSYAVPWMCGALPGVMTINGASHWRDAILWFEAGAEMRVTAVANPGFAFAGWENHFGSPRAPQQVFAMHGGWVLRPRFVPAATVTVASIPPGLQVRVDGAPVITPQTFEWEPEVGHALAPVSPQRDAEGRYWWFDSWLDGGEAERVFRAPAIQEAQSVTARYVPAAVVTILTEPAGLKLNIDGSDVWPSPNFIWGIGSTHRLVAPAEQADSSGRRYAFRDWSDGVQSPSRQITAAEQLRLAARYELLGRLVVDSSPSGQTLLLAGEPCLTPCTLDRAAGTRLTVEAPATVPLSEDTRLDFQGWDDSGARARNWTFSAEAGRITAAYRTMHRVAAAADPAGGARFRFDPPSGDGFHPAGTRLLVAAEPEPGFAFRGWKGDLEGAAASGLVLVTQPRNLIAVLDRVPYLAPAGVVNAAGATPERAVAAGSLIAIYGAHLAPATVTGPASPLAQTLAGVTVQVSGRPLPLLFVSPGQINALLPSDFKAGSYRLTVRCAGQPDVSAEFSVTRNAPGLFAVFLRSDGSLVLPASPARPGEALTLFGTGFGPFYPNPPDGFPVPAEPEFPAIDPVVILAGDLAFPPQQAKAAAGLSGVVAVTFRAPAQPPAASLPLKVRINGRESNTVLLHVSGQ